MYTIELDPTRKLVTITHEGFLGLAAAEQYVKELSAALANMRRIHRSFDMLVNLEKACALSQEVVAYMRHGYDEEKKMGVRKFACVCVGAVQLMQFKRLTAQDENYQAFPTTEDALAWLAE